MKGGLRKIRPNQIRSLDYSTLSLEEIRGFLNRCPKANNHILFVWTIDKFLRKTEDMFCDYRLHARFIWNKGNGVAPAFTVRYSHEYLLWLYKGKMLPIAKKYRGKYTSVFNEPPRRHSQKPIFAYEMIENLYPLTDKIELFARSKREGWDVWGDEVESDIELGGER